MDTYAPCADGCGAMLDQRLAGTNICTRYERGIVCANCDAERQTFRGLLAFLAQQPVNLQGEPT